MKFRRKLLSFIAAALLGALMVPAAYAQQHQNTATSWIWPHLQDPSTPENQKKVADVTAWLYRHGFTGSYRVATYLMDAPLGVNAPPAPKWPFLFFCSDGSSQRPALAFDRFNFDEWTNYADNPKCRVVDFEQALKSPGVLIGELQNRFQFGNPSIMVPYPDPVPAPDKAAPAPLPKPTSPVGREFAPGKYYALDPSVQEHSDERGKFVVESRETPFGLQYWFRKL